MRIYRQPLDDVPRMAPHTRDAKGESLVATLSLSAGAAGNVHSILTDADMPWPTVKPSDGTGARIDAESEREVHARVDRGEPVTGEGFTKLYGDILRRYHGEAQGVVRIDDLYAVEWTCIPHFYSAYYVYRYATSIAASSLLAVAILEGRPGARERYLELIRSGGSDYPYELVKRAGVDLATAAPYEALSRRMNRIMDEIEAILAKRGK